MFGLNELLERSFAAGIVLALNSSKGMSPFCQADPSNQPSDTHSYSGCKFYRRGQVAKGNILEIEDTQRSKHKADDCVADGPQDGSKLFPTLRTTILRGREFEPIGAMIPCATHDNRANWDVVFTGWTGSGHAR